ncbi:MAG TPA: NUDIX domain-containing protein [Micromonosporaceae bacterium]|nr:NUDIX domain-containing protein [Micromonosporaceae bacterium]
MGMSEHVARLRAAVGHDLLLLPSVSLVITDEAGRLLLVRHAGHGHWWGVPGGAVDVGESPAETAVREAREELDVEVRPTALLEVLGGPDYEVVYPNGDRVAYVTSVYRAEIVAGEPNADGDEISEFRWFAPAELGAAPISRFTRALLTAVRA